MGMTGAEAVTEPRSGTWTAILRGTGEEYLREREEMRMLFKLARDASPEDVRQAVRIIEALRRDD